MRAFLFPLHKVSYQAILRKPLNIFEPRYIRMIHDAEMEGVPVALTYANLGQHVSADHGSIPIEHEKYGSVRRITGLGRVQILQKSKDGSMLVVLEPFAKGEIISVYNEDAPYNTIEVENIPEFLTVMPEHMISLQKLQLVFREWAKSFFKNQAEYDALMHAAEDPIVLVGAITEFVITSPDLKQGILEIDDINAKIDVLLEWMN
ncbi:LON peptidase substrate-binding domain-containing protein [Halobacteriovorax sp. YZS-1-1]|uniref:LON peptidase substrate-binding domain-containing protein n=1 Tax=unclassified Halobacteriovorax TaxID=2639665 RepID=UPI0039999C9F